MTGEELTMIKFLRRAVKNRLTKKLRQARKNLNRARVDYVKNLQRERILRAEAWRIARETRRKARLDRRRIREAMLREREKEFDRFRRDAHISFHLGVILNCLALWEFFFASRKKRRFPLLMATLLLFISAGHFFLDFLERKAEDV